MKVVPNSTTSTATSTVSRKSRRNLALLRPGRPVASPPPRGAAVSSEVAGSAASSAGGVRPGPRGGSSVLSDRALDLEEPLPDQRLGDVRHDLPGDALEDLRREPLRDPLGEALDEGL